MPVDEHWRLDLSAIDAADAARALCLWVNTPGNPAGGLDDLGAAAAWGRAHGVPVLQRRVLRRVHLGRAGRARSSSTALDGVVAVHSLSKRSNLAGVRAGFYAGDAELVAYLSRGAQARRASWCPARCRPRRSSPSTTTRTSTRSASATGAASSCCGRCCARRRASTSPSPGGGFYLWVPAPAATPGPSPSVWPTEGGALVSPGEFYGEAGAGHVRVAVVQPDDRLALVGERLAALRGSPA